MAIEVSVDEDLSAIEEEEGEDSLLRQIEDIVSVQPAPQEDAPSPLIFREVVISDTEPVEPPQQHGPAMKQFLKEEESHNSLMQLLQVVESNDCFDSEDASHVQEAIKHAMRRLEKARKAKDLEMALYPKIEYMRTRSQQRIDLLKSIALDFEGRHKKLGEYFLAKQEKLSTHIATMETMLVRTKSQMAKKERIS